MTRTGTLLLDIHSSFKESLRALGGLALVCLAPLFASAKIPAGLPDCRTDPDPEHAAPFTRTSAQSPQSGEQQAPQPPPLTTERMASKPPQISYVDGQLTIVAESSRLSEVMSALRAAMGTDVDLPVSVADQRIWVRLGPGPARQVLRDLLDNTELNYVIQASDSDEQGVRKVLLTLRGKTGEQSVTGSRVARGTSRRNLPESSNPVEVPDQDSSTPAESASVSDAAPAGPPPPPPSTSAQSAASRLPSAPGASNPTLSRVGAGASEQMIQQLQTMYQQRRQMQIQQNQKPPSNNN